MIGSFRREARWMLIVGLMPVAAIGASLIWTWMRRG